MQEIVTWDNYYDAMQPVLIHELAHQFGAPDHYHEEDDGNCLHGDICSGDHNKSPKKRPAYCIMNDSWADDITTRDVNQIFCDGCKEDILAYLNEN